MESAGIGTSQPVDVTKSVTRYPVLVDGVRFKPECLVYGLVDPREPGRIRYVGKTEKGALHRHMAHIGQTDGHGARRRQWMADLRKARRMPHMVLIERVTDGPVTLGEREEFWIRHFKAIGQADANGPLPVRDATIRAQRAEYRRTGIMPPRVVP